ncbi:hypothetical protein B0T22DRAFT_372309, partial [Podospora appendiculata]
NMADKDREEILDWLSPLNFWPTQQEVLKRRKEGTSVWIVNDPMFLRWTAGETKRLWCTGIPGAGKTVIASFIADYLQKVVPDSTDAVALVMFDYRRPETHVMEDLITSITRQLLVQHATLPNALTRLYSRHKMMKTRPSRAETVAALHDAAALFKSIHLVVDALDEYSEATQALLVPALAGLKNLRTLVTSRWIPAISNIWNYDERMEIRAHDADVERFIVSEIAEKPRLLTQVKRSSDLQNDIVDSIVKSARGMFLLARFHMDYISTKNNPRAIRQALKLLTNTLDKTYCSAMDRIWSQITDDRVLAEKALFWVAFSKRPMSIREMQHAVTIMEHDPDQKVDDLDFTRTEIHEDELPDVDTILSVCAGLVMLEPASMNSPYCYWVPSASDLVLRLSTTRLTSTFSHPATKSFQP